MVFAPHPWTRWTALLAAALAFLVFQTQLHQKLAGASLEVRSVPAGAEVRLDGQPVGQTNLTLSGLSAGPIEVEVRRTGYLTARQRVTLARSRTALVVFALEPQPVEVALKVSGPHDYRVELGPEPARQEENPKKLWLEPGPYDLVVSSKGYRSLRRKLEVKPNSPQTLTLELAEIPQPTPTPAPPAPPPRPAAPVYVPPPPPRYYPPAAPRYYPPPPPPAYRPAPVFTPIPAAPDPVYRQPIMTPLP